MLLRNGKRVMIEWETSPICNSLISQMPFFLSIYKSSKNKFSLKIVWNLFVSISHFINDQNFTNKKKSI